MITSFANLYAVFENFAAAFTHRNGLQRGRNRPRRAILCVVGAILWFTRFGGRFQFPEGRFLQVEAY